MKLSSWARKQGGELPHRLAVVQVGQAPCPRPAAPLGHHPGGGTSSREAHGAQDTLRVTYARVSSADQKEDLERQVERLKAFAQAQGWAEYEVVAEVGSAMRKRRRLLQVLADPGVSRIVVEKRHHLNQFDFPLVEAALRASGRRILVLEDECG